MPTSMSESVPIDSQNQLGGRSEDEELDTDFGQLRIKCFSSEKSQEWTNITDNLDIPVVLKDGMVTFQIKISAGKIKMFSVYL